MQYEPGIGRALTDSAIRHRDPLRRDAGLGIDALELVVVLEGAVIVCREIPGHVDGRWDVTRAIRLLLRQMGGREHRTGVLIR